jgi:C4-dicarboxylate transporter DctM subunit
METLILFAMVLGFLFVGVPVGLSLGLSSILYVALFTTESLSSVAISLLVLARTTPCLRSHSSFWHRALCRPVV